jgi:hypothetical protein
MPSHNAKECPKPSYQKLKRLARTVFLPALAQNAGPRRACAAIQKSYHPQHWLQYALYSLDDVPR